MQLPVPDTSPRFRPAPGTDDDAPPAQPISFAPTAEELERHARSRDTEPLPPPPTTRSEPTRPGPRRWIQGSVQTLGFLAIAYLCLFNLSVVRGSSMAPRIHDGDRILIDHFSYLFHGVERGDIVVLKYPLDPSVDYIKRVIGLPGDEIVLRDAGVYVNGERLEEPYVEDPDDTSYIRLVVKPAHFFVLGDNRRRSCDSREFGLVPQDYVRGRVELRVWPPDRVGRIDD